MNLGELFIQLGVVGDTKQVKEFDKKVKELAKDMNLTLKSTEGLNKGIGTFVKGIASAGAALIGTVAALDRMINSLTKSNQSWINLTRTTDISLKTFQKWGNIGKLLGVDNAAQQLEGLNERLFELRLTGEGARGFQLAGINPMWQNAQGVLEQLRGRIQGMDDTSASYLLRQMGLDPQMLHLLRMTREEFEDLYSAIQGYQLTQQQREEIQRLNIQLQITGTRLRYLKDRAILAIMPAFTKFMTSLAGSVERLAKMVNYVTDFIKKSPQLQQALMGIALALGIIFAAANPLIAIFTALYLIIDDIAAYFNGGGSLLGVFLKNLDDYITDLKEKFGDLSFDKIIPEVTLDVSKVIIKAGKISLENAEKFIGEQLFQGRPMPNIITSLYALTEGIKLQYHLIKDIAEKNGVVTGEAASIGYIGALPELSPPVQRNITSSSTVNNYDNRQVNQTNSIQSSQPVFDIQNELIFARNAFNASFA